MSFVNDLSEVAKEYGLDYIVTRNISDFLNSKVKTLQPDVFINLIIKE